MPRRTIYIKNQKDGSNFRIVGDGSGSFPRPPKKKKSKRATLPSGVRKIDGKLYNPNGTPYKPSPAWHANENGLQWDWKTRSYLQPEIPTSYSGMDFGTAPSIGAVPQWSNFMITTPTPVQYPYDLVGWVSYIAKDVDVTTQTYTSQSKFSGKTEKKKIVVTYKDTDITEGIQ